MNRDDVEDARYSIKAWSNAVPWTAVFAGLGVMITGYFEKNTVTFAAGFVAVATGIFPRIRPKFAYELARTAAMKRGWVDVPKDEKPLITREIVIGPKGVKERQK